MKKSGFLLFVLMFFFMSVNSVCASISVSGDLLFKLNVVRYGYRYGRHSPGDFSIQSYTKDLKSVFGFEGGEFSGGLMLELIDNYRSEDSIDKLDISVFAAYENPGRMFGYGAKLGTYIQNNQNHRMKDKNNAVQLSPNCWFQINDIMKLTLRELDTIVGRYEMDELLDVGDVTSYRREMFDVTEEKDALGLEFSFPNSTLNIRFFDDDPEKIGRNTYYFVRLTPSSRMTVYEGGSYFTETSRPVIQAGYDFSIGHFDLEPGVHYAHYKFKEDIYKGTFFDGTDTDLLVWAASLPVETSFWIMKVRAELTTGQNLGDTSLFQNKGLVPPSAWYQSVKTDADSGVSTYPFRHVDGDYLGGWIAVSIGRWTVAYGQEKIVYKDMVRHSFDNKYLTYTAYKGWNGVIEYNIPIRDNFSVLPGCSYLSGYDIRYKNALLFPISLSRYERYEQEKLYIKFRLSF